MNVRAQWIAVLLIGLSMGGFACSSTSEDDLSNENDGGGDGDGDNGDGDGDNGDGDGDNGDGDGDGDNGDGDGDVSPTDAGGDGDGDGDNGDGDGDGPIDAGDGMVCGSAVCPMNGCCADPFQSLCGLALSEQNCIKPPPPDESSDERCPELSVGGFFTFPSCCTPEGDCGLNASEFVEGADCVELTEFEMRAAEMAGGMLFFDVPEPQRCDE